MVHLSFPNACDGYLDIQRIDGSSKIKANFIEDLSLFGIKKG